MCAAAARCGEEEGPGVACGELGPGRLTMKVQEARVLPLFSTNAASEREQAEGENQHTLVELVTDEGVTGLGGVYTSALLVKGALAVLRSRLIGASAIDPARVSET